MSKAQVAPAPRRRGRPRNPPPQFQGKVIKLSSRPRLVVGDVVELCRSCLPSNQGKLATIEAFQDDGRVLVRSMSLPFDTFDPETGEPTGQDMTAAMLPVNLYRRSRELAKGAIHG